MLTWTPEPDFTRVHLPNSAFSAAITLTQWEGATAQVNPSARIGTLRMLSPCCSATYTLTAPHSACSQCGTDSQLDEAQVGPTLIFLYSPNRFQWDVGGDWHTIVETWTCLAGLDPLVGVLVASELKEATETYVLAAVDAAAAW